MSALEAKAWPFAEARRLLRRLDARAAENVPAKEGILFETGYGPSGLPHIGTFGEVLRTTMVQHAFQTLSDVPTRLVVFSDDMDGLRKVPDNVPNREMLATHLGKPLTQVPDPFGTHESFGHHNNARLRAFLDAFGFEYDFMSATDCYRSGRFDAALLKALACYRQIMEIMLPSLGEERRQTYSPFLPICPETGAVLQAPVLEINVAAGAIFYQRPDGTTAETLVTGGRCKLQWKADWAMRWVALGVDYEMAGKDLAPSVALSTRIARILGARPPETLIYELFLDETGRKISKSKGNGLSIEEWLAYAPQESLAFFMYGKPGTAKRLYFDVIPKTVDEYYAQAQAFLSQDADVRLENPVWHIHGGSAPATPPPLSFTMLLNLAAVCNATDAKALWGFIARYAPGATPEREPELDRLARYAARYSVDFVAAHKRYRLPTETERAALTDLRTRLVALPANADGEAIQTAVYETGKAHAFPTLRDWFGALYETLLGQTQGPRMGSFIALYSIPETCALIDRALAGTLATETTTDAVTP